MYYNYARIKKTSTKFGIKKISAYEYSSRYKIMYDKDEGGMQI